jgi:hypothetical protein
MMIICHVCRVIVQMSVIAEVLMYFMSGLNMHTDLFFCRGGGVPESASCSVASVLTC